MLRVEDQRIIYEYDGESMWLEPWGKNSLRVRAAKLRPIDESMAWALLPRKETQAKAEVGEWEGEPAAFMENGSICARVQKNGRITITDRDGKVLLQEFVRNRSVKGTNFSPMMLSGREFLPMRGPDRAITVRFESDPEEKLYGMGQYQQELLNLKGAVLELAHRNSQVSIPFVLSDKNYGFFWNNPAVGTASFGTNRTEWKAESAPQVDYWVTAGENPRQIMHQYAVATGMPSMMPDFAMGFWQCKMRYRTQEELLNVAREYKRRKLPISVIIIDFFHWPNQGVWDFDERYWPDPVAMVKELEEMGIKLFVSVWPTVDPKSPNYPEMLEKGYLIHTDRGNRTQLECGGYEVFYDATNPGAREFVWEKIKQNYYDRGIKYYWLDAAEPETIPYHFDNLRYHMGSALEVANIYPYYYEKTVYDGLIAQGETELINLERCAWAGSQSIATLVWSGDIVSSFHSMRRQIVAGLHMAVAGIPWWTTDIGGFDFGDPNDPAFRELLVRWFQYGVFCPVFRLHGARVNSGDALEGRGYGGAPSGADTEGWSYGEEAYEILSKYLFLRERIRPYIKEQMQKCHEEGIPPMRPLFTDYPGDKKAWEVKDQFLFGPDILVSPITHAGQTTREVVLPAGTRWTEVTTGITYDGGQTVTCEAPLSVIPLFVREGGSLEAGLLKIQ